MVILQSNEEMASFEPDNATNTPIFGFNHDVLAKEDNYFALIAEAIPSEESPDRFYSNLPLGIDSNVSMLDIGVVNTIENGARNSYLIIAGAKTIIFPLTNNGIFEIVEKTIYAFDDNDDLNKYLYDRFGVNVSFFTINFKSGDEVCINIANAIWPGQSIKTKQDYPAQIDITGGGSAVTVRFDVAITPDVAIACDFSEGSGTSIQLAGYENARLKKQVDTNTTTIIDLGSQVTEVNNKINKVIGDSQAIYVSR